jgi:bifunctional non-homologous end joining protein LigD
MLRFLLTAKFPCHGDGRDMLHLQDLKPMLLDERPLDLSAPGWIYEIKFDGYRLMAEFGNGTCKLQTRNGADATRWFPEVTRSLASVKGGPYLTDGEVCVLDDLGRSDFDRLQDRARRRRWFEGAEPVVYCAFDLLVHGGIDVMQTPLRRRKQLLADLLKPPPPNILYVSHFEEDARPVFEQVVAMKLEGLVAKRADSVYAPGKRSTDWVKVKRKGAIPAERFKRGPKSKDRSIGL